MLDLATFIADSPLAHFPTERKIFPQIITLSFPYLSCFINGLWLLGYFYYLNLAHKVCTDLALTNLTSTISGFTVEMYSTTCILLQNEWFFLGGATPYLSMYFPPFFLPIILNPNNSENIYSLYKWHLLHCWNPPQTLESVFYSVGNLIHKLETP